MENAKIEKIKKAAAITAKILNVFEIILIVMMILCVFNGVVSLLYKGKITLIVLSYSIGIGVITGLTFWCLYCIYDYGIVLQINDDETL